MNTLALTVMLAITGLWLGLLAVAAYLGSPVLTGVFALASAAMFVRRDWLT